MAVMFCPRILRCAVPRGKPENETCSSKYDREEGVSESKSAKRRAGRLQKWIGDTCLLAGSPKVRKPRRAGCLTARRPGHTVPEAAALEAEAASHVLCCPRSARPVSGSAAIG